MSWVSVGVAAVGMVSSNVQANKAKGASRGAARLQSEEAARQAQGIRDSAATQQGFFNPYQQVGQQGVDLAGFLGDPSQQTQFLQSNPTFQLGLQNLNQQTSKSAASRGRLTAGDTLMQLQNNAMLAGQPLIDRQRQDILNLLNIGTQTAGQKALTERNASAQIADLLTGGSAAEAAGVVGAANASNANIGNIYDVTGQLAGNQGVQDYFGSLFSGGGSGGGSGVSSGQFVSNNQSVGWGG